MTRVLVCGGREFGDRELAFRTLDTRSDGTWSEIIQGGASGADELGRAWAYLRDIEIRTFYADWAKDGRAAGPIRNQRMIDVGRPDLVIAFPGGKGTADMISRAKAASIEVIEVQEKENDGWNA